MTYQEMVLSMYDIENPNTTFIEIFDESMIIIDNFVTTDHLLTYGLVFFN